MNKKPVIYQLLPRLFANKNNNCIPYGTYEQNGAGKLNDITPIVLKSIKELGITHIWYTGIIEHAHKTDYTQFDIPNDNPYVIKGNAGSPYAIKDYYDVDPDLAVNIPDRIKEFEQLVSRTHKEGMKVIIDFVPNHVARQYYSDAKPDGIKDLGSDDDKSKFFSPSNNFYYIPNQSFAPNVNLGYGDSAYNEFPAKASGNDCFTASPGEFDWYDTIKLNYGVDYSDGTRHFYPTPNTWTKMLNILQYWASKGVDGFRCDMVHMVPLEFWEWAIPAVKELYPNIIFIAEIYDPNLYHDFIKIGGFDYLYDKVTLYDTLRAIQCSNVSAACITNCWQTVDGINANMLNFLENHDEQRFGSKQYAGDPGLVIPSLVVSSMINTGPMMIYAGQELGEQASDAEGYSGHDGRTTIFDYWSIPTIRRWFNDGKCDETLLSGREIWLRNKYKDILNICNKEKAIREGLFFDLMYVNYDNPCFNPHRQYAFIRSSTTETLLIVVNFSAETCDLKINLPKHAFEFLNIPECICNNAIELLSGDNATKALKSDSPFECLVGGNNAVIWKISHKNIISSKKISPKQSTKKIKK